MTQKPRLRKYPTSKLDLVDISSPKLYYTVQLLMQEAGIILVNLATGKHILGQVNLPQIGMIILDKDTKPKNGFGFMAPLEQMNGKTDKLQDVDATLVCESFEAAEGQPLVLVVQVVDHNFLDDWKRILNFIGNSLVRRVRGQSIPQVVFTITSLCDPDPANPNSAKEAVLEKMQDYGFSGEVYAVSHDSNVPEDLDDEEGDEEDEV